MRRPSLSSAVPVVIIVAMVGTVMAMVPGRHGAGMGYDRYALPKELCSVAVVLAAALLASWRRRSSDFAVRFGIEDVSLAGFLVLGCASLALARNTWLGERALAMSVAGAATFWTVRSIDHRGRAAVAWGALLAVGLGAIGVLVESQGWVAPLSLPGRMPGGTEGNRNFMAHALVLGVPAVLALCIGARRRRTAALAAIVLLLLAWAVTLSRCRAAWLAAVFGLLAMATVAVIANRRTTSPRRSRRLLAVAALAGGILFAALVPNRLRWGEDRPLLGTIARLAEHQHGTGRGRLIQYRSTLSVIAAHPVVGVGPGNWPIAYPFHAAPGDPNVQPRSVEPVNRLPNSDWLGLASERGLPAVTLLVLCLVALCGRTWLAARREATPASALRAAVITATLVELAVLGALDAVLLRPTTSVLAFAILGAFAATPCPRTPPAVVRFGLRWIAPAALVVLASWLVAAGVRNLQAGMLAPRGNRASLVAAARLTPQNFKVQASLAFRAVRAGDCAEARRRAQLALDAYPALPVLRELTCPRASPEKHGAARLHDVPAQALGDHAKLVRSGLQSVE